MAVLNASAAVHLLLRSTVGRGIERPLAGVAPLLTAEARLVLPHGHEAEVELFEP